ncbi:MAG: peptidoglycan/xylan/chitin deacetylase (PgdA/CDA1 family) [Planctomycetota bacterium]|jgi:peptidoglycan/xylan/chitin deacetylase (PgdA/CDA1 family)
MYHSVDSSGSPISIGEAEFERHVAWLASGKVRVVPFAEIGTLPATQDAVAITFDDAFRNFGEFAWPRLKEHGLPATQFVVSDHTGATNKWGGRSESNIPSLPLHDWDELARLAESGVELGCHSRTHPDMSKLPRTAIEAEMLESQAMIEDRTGVVTRSFAYPYGYHGTDARELAMEHFDQSCTTELAVLPERPQLNLLPRLDAWYYRSPAALARLSNWGSFGFRAHLRVRATARRLKASLSR